MIYRLVSEKLANLNLDNQTIYKITQLLKSDGWQEELTNILADKVTIKQLEEYKKYLQDVREYLNCTIVETDSSRFIGKPTYFIKGIMLDCPIKIIYSDGQLVWEMIFKDSPQIFIPDEKVVYISKVSEEINNQYLKQIGGTCE